MTMLTRAHNLWRLTPSLYQAESKDIDLERGPDTKDYFNRSLYTDLRKSLVQSYQSDDPVQRECWRWYCSYLDNSLRMIWDKVLQGVIRDLGPNYPKDATEWPGQISNVYKVLQVVVDAISSRKDVSIDGIIEELNRKPLLRTGPKDGLDGHATNENEIRQMVWCLVGMVTMLYDAKPKLHSKQLSIRQPTSGLRYSASNRPGGSGGYGGQQDITRCEESLHRLLAPFGDLLPEVQVDQRYLDSVDMDYINIAYINFYTLKNVAKLDIEWVNTLSLHLQLDKRRRVLRLFRFPASCRLLWTENEPSFMSQLFADHRRTQVDGNLHTEHTFSDYLREVMLSYRLLFGIDQKSRNAFTEELPAWHAGLQHSSSRAGAGAATNSTASTGIGLGLGVGLATDNSIPNPSATPTYTNDRPTNQHQQHHPYDNLIDDPLLLLLCTTTTTIESNSRFRRWFRRWILNCGYSCGRSRRPGFHQEPLAPYLLNDLLQSLHGEEKSGLYDLEDFPFLGRRLAELQRFSQKQKPNDWKSLFWVDRRDPQSFWNFWIAWVLLIIGGGTIVLQFWQLFFQIYGTFKQP